MLTNENIIEKMKEEPTMEEKLKEANNSLAHLALSILTKVSVHKEMIVEEVKLWEATKKTTFSMFAELETDNDKERNEFLFALWKAEYLKEKVPMWGSFEKIKEMTMILDKIEAPDTKIFGTTYWLEELPEKLGMEDIDEAKSLCYTFKHYYDVIFDKKQFVDKLELHKVSAALNTVEKTIASMSVIEEKMIEVAHILMAEKQVRNYVLTEMAIEKEMYAMKKEATAMLKSEAAEEETEEEEEESEFKETNIRAKTKKFKTFGVSTFLIMFLFFVASANAAMTDKMIMDTASFLSSDFLEAAKEVVTALPFESFGKMDSAIYRAMFQDLTTEYKLSDAAMCMVIFLTVMIKSKARIEKAIKANEKLRAMTTVMEASNFIKEKCTTYVSATMNQFPLVKLPESFASISMVYFCGFNTGISISKVFATQWFGHLNLNPFMQDMHEMFMRFFWTQIVTKTKNNSRDRDADRKVGVFYSDIYQNTVKDKFAFLTADGLEVNPAPKTIDEVVKIVNDIKAAIQYDVAPLASNDKTLIPPRKDWRFFHPRFVFDTKSGTADNYVQKGDYDLTTGVFDESLTKGPLTDWLASIRTLDSLISAAPAVTKIQVDTNLVELVYG